MEKRMKELMGRADEVNIMEPVIITDSNFKQMLSEHENLVIDCWAAWCGPCKMIAPVIEQLAKEYSGKVTFGKLDVDKNPRVPTQYGIMGIPTLLFFKNGKLVDRIVGAAPKPMIEQAIQKNF